MKIGTRSRSLGMIAVACGSAACGRYSARFLNEKEKKRASDPGTERSVSEPMSMTIFERMSTNDKWLERAECKRTYRSKIFRSHIRLSMAQSAACKGGKERWSPAKRNIVTSREGSIMQLLTKIMTKGNRMAYECYCVIIL